MLRRALLQGQWWQQVRTWQPRPFYSASSPSWLGPLAAAAAASALAVGLPLAEDSRHVKAEEDARSSLDDDLVPSNHYSTFKQRVFGSYENRLRRFSTPEKVFAYFASVERGGEIFMTFNDLVRAVTPFAPHVEFQDVGTENFKYSLKPAHQVPPEGLKAYKQACAAVINHRSETESGTTFPQAVRHQRLLRRGLKIPTAVHHGVLQELGVTPAQFDVIVVDKHGQGRLRVVELLDEDGDGLISLDEFMLVSALLAIPTKLFSIAFRVIDSSQDGYVDQAEFESMMSMIVQRAPSVRGNAPRWQALTVGAPSSTTPSAQEAVGVAQQPQHDSGSGRENRGLWKYFFGADGTQRLSYDVFVDFCAALRDAVESTEFNIYDSSCTGDLSPWEFACYLAARCHPRRQKQLLARVEHLRDTRIDGNDRAGAGCVSFEQFRAFNHFLEHLDEFEVAINLVTGNDSERGLDRDEFLAVATAATGDGGQPLGQGLLSILFQMFDRDGDGCVSQNEIVAVLQEHKNMTSRLMQSQDMRVTHLWRRVADCLERAKIGAPVDMTVIDKSALRALLKPNK